MNCTKGLDGLNDVLRSCKWLNEKALSWKNTIAGTANYELDLRAMDTINLRPINGVANDSVNVKAISDTIKPSFVSKVRADGHLDFIHTLTFTISADDYKGRNLLRTIAQSKVVAKINPSSAEGIWIEEFGTKRGLVLSGLEHQYTDPENGNFYVITLSGGANSAAEPMPPVTRTSDSL